MEEQQQAGEEGRAKVFHHLEEQVKAVCRLVVRRAGILDSAQYVCTATNSYGSANRTLSLRVQVASTVPCTHHFIFLQDVPSRVPLMEVEDYSSRAANLSWTPPYDGNSPITAYNIIYKTYRWILHLV